MCGYSRKARVDLGLFFWRGKPLFDPRQYFALVDRKIGKCSDWAEISGPSLTIDSFEHWQEIYWRFQVKFPCGHWFIAYESHRWSERGVHLRKLGYRFLKIVFFTSEGQGPALAYSKLREYKPKMIAVTFPLHFSVKRAESGERYFPRIAEDIRCFFNGVKIDVVVPPSLPFDSIDGLDGHNQQVKVILQTIAIFGSGFGLCVQAVLRACDVGLLNEGEPVIAISGDTAGLFVASTTGHFLNKNGGLQVQEIFCKARNLTISRPTINQLEKPQEKRLLEGEVSS
jgi:hypothetical protein